MEKQQRHIIFRIVSTLIVVILLIPSGIKLIHVFEHENHPQCSNIDTDNFHECEVDCVLLKYSLQHHNLKSQNYNISIYLINNFEIPSATYGFFYNHRVLSFSLRGPPTLV